MVSLVKRSAVDVVGLAEALAGETQDGGVVDEAVDRGHRLALGREKAGPFGKTAAGR